MSKIRHLFTVWTLATLAGAGMVWGSGNALSEASDTTPAGQFAFDPVSVEASSPSILLSRLGSYRGGWFSRNTGTFPVYDPRTKRLFVGSVDRQAIEALDISDPEDPVKVLAIPVAPYGSEPNDIAFHKGVLAVSVKTTDNSDEPSRILFFNAFGDMLADPIELPGVDRVQFTPNGQKLVAKISGGLNEETLQIDESKIAVIHIGEVNWGVCRDKPEGCHLEPTVRLADFSGFDKDDLRAAGVRIFLSEILAPILPPGVDLTTGQEMDFGAFDITHDSRFAYVSLQRNNALATVDLERVRITEINPLGYLDHSVPGFGMDVSDKDGAINVANWPLRSVQEPDKIGVIRSRGRRFILAVNEGDPYDVELPQGTVLPDGTVLPEDTEYAEKARVKDLVLDELAFPDAASLQLDENMGRLQVSQIDGYVMDAEGNKIFRELYVLGSRSLSVLTPKGETVFDSGEAFERITEQAAVEQGLSFNCAEDENDADKRSDDRGPEPEPLALGKMADRTYAFIGFERVSGIVVYDVTDPYGPRFQQYINNRNFAVEPKDVCGEKGAPALPTCALAGDLETEGILFISQQDSPIGVPLLAVNHELSDSTTLYRIDQMDEDHDDE